MVQFFLFSYVEHPCGMEEGSREVLLVLVLYLTMCLFLYGLFYDDGGVSIKTVF
jgi:hypothetical protein